MNSERSVRRRQFLRCTAGALGALASGPSVATAPATPDQEGPSSASREALAKLMADLEAKARQYPGMPVEDGRFLALLVKAANARKILEVGTAYGLATIWLSLGLAETGGNVVTIDINPDRVRAARQHVAAAGFSSSVRFREGDAHQVLPTLEGPFDFVFLHADKEGQVDYFNKLFPRKLPPGALLLVHNAIRLREFMEDYLDLVRKHPDFDSVILSCTMDDAFCVSYRRKS
jgi:predicted O-methyltransferase YrrM